MSSSSSSSSGELRRKVDVKKSGGRWVFQVKVSEDDVAAFGCQSMYLIAEKSKNDERWKNRLANDSAHGKLVFFKPERIVTKYGNVTRDKIEAVITQMWQVC